mgnify:CR=1 FL=1
MEIPAGASKPENEIRQDKSNRKDCIPGNKFNGKRIISYPAIKPEMIVQKYEQGCKNRDKSQYPFVHTENVLFNIAEYLFQGLKSKLFCPSLNFLAP